MTLFPTSVLHMQFLEYSSPLLLHIQLAPTLSLYLAKRDPLTQKTPGVLKEPASATHQEARASIFCLWAQWKVYFMHVKSCIQNNISGHMAFISSQFCTFYPTCHENPACASTPLLQTTLLHQTCLRIPRSRVSFEASQCPSSQTQLYPYFKEHLLLFINLMLLYL